MKTNAPIGIFDSGIGGLTITRALVNRLPYENIIYFGDTAHLPYGDKSTASIQTWSIQIADILLAKKCKLILIACNSASAAAYERIKAHVGRRAVVMNVIEPVIDSLNQYHHSNTAKKTTIGLIGTRQTVNSCIYQKIIAARYPTMTLIPHATNLLAAAIEEFGSHPVTDSLLATYLADPILKNIEALILACTHYPVIKQRITDFFTARQQAVTIIDPSDAVAAAVQTYLTKNNLCKTQGVGEKHFYVSDYTPSFAAGTQRFFTESLTLEHYPLSEETIEQPA